jgi:hypothetical protein
MVIPPDHNTVRGVWLILWCLRALHSVCCGNDAMTKSMVPYLADIIRLCPEYALQPSETLEISWNGSHITEFVKKYVEECHLPFTSSICVMNKPCEYCQNMLKEHVVQYHYHSEFITAMCEAVHRVAYRALNKNSIRGLVFPGLPISIGEENGQPQEPQSSLGPLIKFDFDELNNVIMRIHDFEVHFVHVEHWHKLTKDISQREGIPENLVEGPNPTYWRRLIRRGGILPPIKVYKEATERSTKEDRVNDVDPDILAAAMQLLALQRSQQ